MNHILTKSLCAAGMLSCLAFASAEDVDAQRSGYSGSRGSSSSSGGGSRSSSSSGGSSASRSSSGSSSSGSYSGRSERANGTYSGSSSSRPSSNSGGSSDSGTNSSRGSYSSARSSSSSDPGSNSTPSSGSTTRRSSYSSAPRSTGRSSWLDDGYTPPRSSSSSSRDSSSSSHSSSSSGDSSRSSSSSTGSQTGRSERALDPLNYASSRERESSDSSRSGYSSSNRYSESSGSSSTESRSSRAGLDLESEAPALSLRGNNRSSESSGIFNTRSSQSNAVNTFYTGADNNARYDSGQHSSNYSSSGRSSSVLWYTPRYSSAYYGASWYPDYSWSWGVSYSSGHWGFNLGYTSWYNRPSYSYPCTSWGGYSSSCSYPYGYNNCGYYNNWYRPGCSSVVAVPVVYSSYGGARLTIGVEYCNTRRYWIRRSGAYCGAYSSWYSNRHCYYSSPCRTYCAYRPYYVDYPAWYGWNYNRNYGYYRDVVSYRSTADAYNDGYDSGYTDGRYDGYQRALSRPTWTTDDAVPAERPFTSDYAELERQGAESFRGGDYEGAVDAFKDAVVARPTDPVAKLNLGHAAFAAARYELAAFSLRRAIILDATLIDRAAELKPQDRYADPAVYQHQYARLAERLKERPDDADLYFLVGYHAFFEGRWQDAGNALEMALRLDASDAAAAELHAAVLDQLAGEKK